MTIIKPNWSLGHLLNLPKKGWRMKGSQTVKYHSFRTQWYLRKSLLRSRKNFKNNLMIHLCFNNTNTFFKHIKCFTSKLTAYEMDIQVFLNKILKTIVPYSWIEINIVDIRNWNISHIYAWRQDKLDPSLLTTIYDWIYNSIIPH